MAEGARLESVYRFIPIEGSNPSLTAINSKNPVNWPGFLLAGVQVRNAHSTRCAPNRFFLAGDLLILLSNLILYVYSLSFLRHSFG